MENLIGDFMTPIRPLQTVLDVFKAQVIASLLALVIFAIFAHQELLSFFLGEFVMLIGNAFLAFNVYRQQKRLAPISILWGFLGGEAGKYLILIVLSFILFKTIPLNGLFYVIGIACPQVLGMLVYLIFHLMV